MRCLDNDKISKKIRAISPNECTPVVPLVVVRARRGAGVQWTPLRSRSTDRAGRRDLEPSRPVWASLIKKGAVKKLP